jgi:hypothetical protein
MVVNRYSLVSRIEIARRPIVSQKTSAKTLALVISLALVSASAFAQVESGTVFIIGYSNNKIIMAADSRAVDEGKAPQDDQCKITILGNKFLFATTGRTSDSNSGVVGWDAVVQARQAFAEVANRPPSNHTFAYDVADRWAVLMRQNIAAHIRPQEFSSLPIGHPFVDGTFAGIAPNGSIQIARVVLFRANTSAVNFTPIEEHTPSDSMQYLPLGGRTDEFTEMSLAKTNRAKADKKITLKQSKTWSFLDSDSDARLVIRYTELVIKYAKDPEHVHGPVDAVELDKGGTFRWIQRKPNCKDN